MDISLSRSTTACAEASRRAYVIRQVLAVLVLQTVLNRGPEVHGKCADLYLDVELLLSVDCDYFVQNDNVIAAVAAGLLSFT